MQQRPRKVSLYLKRTILQVSIAKSEKMKGVPFFKVFYCHVFQMSSDIQNVRDPRFTSSPLYSV